MTRRQTYTASMAIACATFTIGGVMLPLSVLARFTAHLDAFWWLEASGSASMVVAIVVFCFGLKAGGHFERDALCTASARKQQKYLLLLFAVGVCLQIFAGLGVSPSSKLVFELALRSLPLSYAAAVWWLIWKPNDCTLT